MIDIHCHILPGIDDGPAEVGESLVMARAAAKDGIATIIATPHVRDRSLAAEEIAVQVARFNSLLQREKVAIEVLPGAEIASHLLDGGWGEYCLANGRHALVEFPASHFPVSAGLLLQQGLAAGFIPVIAHPERNPGVLRHPDLLVALVEMGVKVQVTAESILGTFGADIQQCAHYLLRRQLVHFIASDAHSLRLRCPGLAKSVKMAAKIIGKNEAAGLVSTNPHSVLASKAS